jgi:predicted Zn-dependent peptidase
MKTLVLASLLALALPALAAEETPLPKDLPAYGADKALPVPTIDQSTLPNGLKVWLVPRSGFPKIDLVLIVRGGTAADAAAQRGTSSLMAQLPTEGTATRDSRQIAEALQAMGGSLGGGASDDGARVSGSALRSHAAELVALAADVALHPSFPPKEVELAKANTLQGLKAQEAQPSFQANREFAAVVFGDHPYRFAALTPAVVEAVTPESLAAAHKAQFRPDQALLVIGGDVERGPILAAVKQAFGGWAAQGAALPATPAAPESAPAQKRVIDRPGSVQSTLRIGRPAISATSPDAVPLAVANVILGGSFHSRITRNLREDKGYTYSPGSSVSRLKEGGSLVFRGDVRSEVTGASINEVRYEFDRMGTTDVGEEELASAKRLTVGLYLFQNQIQGAVVGTLANNWLMGLPPDYLGSYVPKVNAVTAAQVRVVSRKYFASKDQTIVVVGDKAKIAADLAQFGEFADGGK